MMEDLSRGPDLDLTSLPPVKTKKSRRGVSVPLSKASPFQRNEQSSQLSSDDDDYNDNNPFKMSKANTKRLFQDSESDKDSGRPNSNDMPGMKSSEENQAQAVIKNLEEKTQTLPDELPPANPLPSGSEKYSLDADQLFGWKPKHVGKVPVPLCFDSLLLEDIIEFFYNDNGDEKDLGQKFPELVYQGFRPETSFILHQRFASADTYEFKFSHLLTSRHAYLRSVLDDGFKRPFLGMKRNVDDDCLQFNSIFESGNLDTVIRKSDFEYDLFLRIDSNTRGHTSWYFFKVNNTKKGHKVRFNIVNLSRSESLYQQGMKPYVFSEKHNRMSGTDWEQTGEHISYKRSHINYMQKSFTENQYEAI